jgi:hypothetical protein
MLWRIPVRMNTAPQVTPVRRAMREKLPAVLVLDTLDGGK